MGLRFFAAYLIVITAWIALVWMVGVRTEREDRLRIHTDETRIRCSGTHRREEAFIYQQTRRVRDSQSLCGKPVLHPIEQRFLAMLPRQLRHAAVASA